MELAGIALAVLAALGGLLAAVLVAVVTHTWHTLMRVTTQVNVVVARIEFWEAHFQTISTQAVKICAESEARSVAVCHEFEQLRKAIAENWDVVPYTKRK